MRRHLLPLLGTVLAVALGTPLSAVVATPAWAHTRLVSSTPAASATAEAPDEVVLVFSDPVRPGLSALSVTGADGEEHVSGTPAAGADGTSVVQALRSPLEPGAYRIAYRVLAADGHPVTGSIEFTAAAAPAADGGATPAPSPVPTPVSTTAPLQPAAGEQQDDGGLPLLPLVVGGLVVAAAAGLVARRVGGAQDGA